MEEGGLKQQRKRSKEIDQMLAAERKKKGKELTLLMLGLWSLLICLSFWINPVLMY